MSAYTLWNVKVRKSYTETTQVLAITENEAYSIARQMPNVVMVESVEWDEPEQDAAEAQDQ